MPRGVMSVRKYGNENEKGRLPSTLMMKTTCPSETQVEFYPTIRWHNLPHSPENPISHNEGNQGHGECRHIDPSHLAYRSDKAGYVGVD